MFRRAFICAVLLFCSFFTKAFGQWTSGGTNMQKTEALLDSLHVATKTMTELTRKIVVLTESNQKSTERMESLTTQITVLTWVVAIFMGLQFILERHRLIEFIKRIWSLIVKALAKTHEFYTEILARHFITKKQQNKKPPKRVSKKRV